MRVPAACVWSAAVVGVACGDFLPRPTEPTSVGPIELPGGQTVGGPPRLLETADGPRFSGVAAYNGRQCSGAFVVPSALDLATDGPAYVLTAGHCPLGPGADPNAVVLSSTQQSFSQFRDFDDSPAAAVEVGGKLVAFASLKGADLALIELAFSRKALRRRGVVPFVLSDQPTTPDEEIAFAGHPFGSPALLSACRFEARVPMLLEAPFHFFDAEANQCAGVRSGASGSPIFSLGTGKVVAVLNTTAEPGSGAECALGRPCEAGPSALVFREGTSYAIPVSGLGACFDASGRLDVTRAACPLDRGNQMLPAVRQITMPATPGMPLAIQVSLENAELTHYRYLVGPAASTNCRDASRYGPVVRWTDAPAIEATVAGEPAIHLVCILAGPGPDPSAAGWQDPSAHRRWSS